MEALLLIILLVLAVVAYGLIRLARRVYARRESPEESERTLWEAILTRPPPKPPGDYGLRQRQRPPGPPRAEP